MGAGCASRADKVIDSKSSKKKPSVVISSPVSTHEYQFNRRFRKQAIRLSLIKI